MMKIEVHCVGRLKDAFFEEACREYAKRLGAYCQLKIVEHPEARLPGDPAPAEIERALQIEGETLLASLPQKGAAIVALCIEGKELSSNGLADWLDQAATQGRSCLCFVIGGSHGLHDSVKGRADLRLSMSPMTFPHTLARVMLLEQLYRAYAILGGSKYHK